MNAQEALVKLSDQGADPDFDDGDGPEGCGWFGWSIDSESPGTGVLCVTWQSDELGTSKQEWYWELTARA